MVCIHSECFIGGVQRDYGEHLEEAIRRLSQPPTIPSAGSSSSRTIPGRGTIIYLCQEGRGIGHKKIRVYNL